MLSALSKMLGSPWRPFGLWPRSCKPSCAMDATRGSGHTAGAAQMKAMSTVTPAGSVLPASWHVTPPACCSLSLPGSWDGMLRGAGQSLWPSAWLCDRSHHQALPATLSPGEVCRLSQSQLGIRRGWWASTTCSWLLLRLVLQAMQTPQLNPAGWCLGKNTPRSRSFVSLQSEQLLFSAFAMNSYEPTGLLDFPLI